MVSYMEGSDYLGTNISVVALQIKFNFSFFFCFSSTWKTYKMKLNYLDISVIKIVYRKNKENNFLFFCWNFQIIKINFMIFIVIKFDI